MHTARLSALLRTSSAQGDAAKKCSRGTHPPQRLRTESAGIRRQDQALRRARSAPATHSAHAAAQPLPCTRHLLSCPPCCPTVPFSCAAVLPLATPTALPRTDPWPDLSTTVRQLSTALRNSNSNFTLHPLHRLLHHCCQPAPGNHRPLSDPSMVRLQHTSALELRPLASEWRMYTDTGVEHSD